MKGCHCAKCKGMVRILVVEEFSTDMYLRVTLDNRRKSEKGNNRVTKAIKLVGSTETLDRTKERAHTP